MSSTDKHQVLCCKPDADLQSKLAGSQELERFGQWIESALEQLVQSQIQFTSPSGTRKSLGR